MVKKLKRWLAAVLAVTVMASSAIVGFAVATISSVPFLTNVCEHVGSSYRYRFDINEFFKKYPNLESNRESFLEGYNYLRSAFGDPSKTIFCATSTRSGAYSLSFFVYDSDTSFVVREISGTQAGFIVSGACYQIGLGFSGTSLTGLSSRFWPEPESGSTSVYGGFFGGYSWLVQGKRPTFPSWYTYGISGYVDCMIEVDGIENITTHTLIVNYLYTEDTPAAVPVVQSLAAGAEYSIPSPEVEGYAPDTPLVTGTMPDEDLTINVFYSRAFYPLTIKYQYADGRKASEDISFQYPLGFVYDVPSPEIEGYQPDKPTIAGEMPGEALEAVVTYTAIPYTLTVNYQYVGGGQAAPSYQEQLIIGSNYYVTSPVIEGYHPNQSAVSGVMPASDVVSTVTYREDSGGSSGPDPVGPGEGGDSGSGDSGDGGGGSGYDPFIPSLPPFSGKDPFVVPDMPEYSGYDPFKIVGPPAYSGYDPFIVPKIPDFSGYDPFVMPDKGGSE